VLDLVDSTVKPNRFSVYRVNWLRAKARKERWEEEFELVKKEMEWTVNCFRYKERTWKEIAESEGQEGHRAYGWKQSSIWRRQASLAAATFGLYGVESTFTKT